MSVVDDTMLDIGLTDPPGSATARRVRFGYAFWIAAIWLGVLVTGSAAASLLPLDDPNVSDYRALNRGPSLSSHLLGTDQLGRDTLSRVLFGARVSLMIAIVAVLVATVLGGLIGVVAGYLSGRVEQWVLLICDAVMAFPNIIVIIVLVTIVGPSTTSLMVGLTLVFLPTFLRLARGVTLSLRTRDFVSAAEASGATNARIVLRELLPNVFWPVITYSVIAVSTAIVAEGSLSFLGLGLRPPTASWGSMISGGLDKLESAPQVSLTPAAIMCVTVLALNVIGERLRARSDDRSASM